MDEETIRTAVALRLGSPICEPHQCKLCGREVDTLGHHGLSCTKSAGRFPRHAALNDVVKRALASAGAPSILEPVGLDRGDGRRPDGLTTFPFNCGKSLAWDATCVDTFAASHVVKCALEPGAAAAAAESRKRERYAGLSDRYIFAPVAVETTGVLGKEAAKLLRDIGSRISAITKDARELPWLRQRISIAVIRGNSAAILATAPTSQHRPASSTSPEVAADTDAIPSTAVAATPTPATEAPSGTRASDLRVIPPETPTLPLAKAPPPPRPVVELPPRPEATPWSRHSAVVGTEWTRLTEVAKSLPPGFSNSLGVNCSGPGPSFTIIDCFICACMRESVHPIARVDPCFVVLRRIRRFFAI